MVSPNSFRSRQMRRNSAEGSLATTLYCCSGISMCSLSICISFKSKSAMRSSSPPSHWKFTLSAPLPPHLKRVVRAAHLQDLGKRVHVHPEGGGTLALELREGGLA